MFGKDYSKDIEEIKDFVKNVEEVKNG